MKLKLKYKATYTFSSADIFDATDTPLEFEAYTRLDPGWAEACRAFVAGGSEDTGQALDIVGMALCAVSQDGERWPIEGRGGAEALRDAVEAENPGLGDQWIRHLATGHYNYHFRRIADLQGNLRAPSPPSGDGNGHER